MAKINRSLDKLDLEFRHMHDELSGKEMYAIVSILYNTFEKSVQMKIPLLGQL